jgi:hypothetical protein
MRQPRELDVVELQRQAGAFPAGTIGTVVSVRSSSALVEIVSDSPDLDHPDLFDDLVSVPYEDLRVLRRETVDELRELGRDPEVVAAALSQLKRDELTRDERFIESLEQMRRDERGEWPERWAAD